MNPVTTLARRLFKPEYVFQPRVAVRRAVAAISGLRSGHESTRRFTLPWGFSIVVPASDDHCRMLTDLGVVDLAVSEVLWRLTDADDYVVDAGANIGCMTAVFAARVSGADGGHILALEAHPVICHDLQRNIDLWAADSTVEVIGAAVSNIEGTVTLVEPAGFSGNRGLAHVASGAEETGRRITVPAQTLDRLVPAAQVIGVLKLDVEGHELHALEGAQHLLREARIRDCVFEDHGKAPSPVMSVLETYGFEIFRIERSLRGPLLLARDAEGHTDWLPANYLATKAPERAQRRCATRGWQTLRRRA